MKRAAFVTPSPDLVAELASRLAKRGYPIDVLTTSTELIDYLRRHGEESPAIVFAGLGPATIEGLPLAGKRASLMPFLRDEPEARTPAVESIFDGARRLLFASDDEVNLAAKLYGPFVWRKSAVVGAGPDWEQVADRCEQALDLRAPRLRPVPGRPITSAVHQLLPSLDYGDAISNQTVFISEVLRDLGYQSEIFVYDIAPQMTEFARRFEPGVFGPQDGLIYHHAIGTAMTPSAIQHPGPKALIYHNITPGRFFEPWDAKFAGILEMGRRDLHNLAPAFPVSVGDSTYNASELREAGFRDPGVMPIFVEPSRWAQAPDPEWMEKFQDGRTNILFVGRIAPNKKQEDLIRAFKEYLAHDPDARLLLVGLWPEGSAYARFLHDEAERLGIGEQVVMTWKVTDAQLLACYRTAHLFWSMSEHEGFCVPLIEAMWFDIPVLAYSSTAIPETLGEGGILFTEKRLPELAALAHIMVQDEELRRKVIAAQRARRPAFLPEAVLPILQDLLVRMGAAQRERAETAPSYASMIRGQR